ncbi:MAG: efflux RND transporter periplasmic adaptor subunit [Candidatus Accumulibacter sp.]|jgi:multidrug efflux system membrane fusion protein|nr:efflux RND transporter periplasmic adaptor subunit [Accumulibacter sp.]
MIRETGDGRRETGKPASFASRLLASVFCLLIAACSDRDAGKEAEPPPVPVTTARAALRDIPVVLQVVGRSEAFESVALKSRVDGQVETVLFTEGQHVQQGDVLIRLDPTDFAARLKQAEAAAARDAALLAKMRADTARYAALKERNFVSEERVADVRTNEATAGADLSASKAAAEVARLQLSYATIRAPITGIVGARLVFPGSAVKANDVTVAVINSVRPLLVSFAVPERYLPQLRAVRKEGRLKVDITEPGDVSRHYEGSVRFIDNTVDVSTGTIQIKAELPNEDEALMPGQFLNVALVLDTLRQAVSVPGNAVQQGPEGNYLYVLKDDGSVDLRRVEALASQDGFTAVRGNLEAGETVVTDGQLRLVPGAKAVVRSEAEGGAKTAGAANQPG